MLLLLNKLSTSLKKEIVLFRELKQNSDITQRGGIQKENYLSDKLLNNIQFDLFCSSQN